MLRETLEVQKNDTVEDDNKVEDGTELVGKTNKRIADNPTPPEKSKKLTDKDLTENSELLNKLFNNNDLSEEFKKELLVVFEMAVDKKVKEIDETLRKEFAEVLKEKVQEIQETTEEKITAFMKETETNLDSYLDHVIKEWYTENKVPLNSSIKVSVAESLIKNLKEVLSEHNIEVEDSKVDIVADLEKSVANAEKKYDKLFAEMKKIEEANLELQKKILFKEAVEDLTISQTEKLSSLLEGLEINSIDKYKEKIDILKEKYLNETTTNKRIDSGSDLEELNESNDNVIQIDETVSNYLKAIDKLMK